MTELLSESVPKYYVMMTNSRVWETAVTCWSDNYFQGLCNYWLGCQTDECMILVVVGIAYVEKPLAASHPSEEVVLRIHQTNHVYISVSNFYNIHINLVQTATQFSFSPTRLHYSWSISWLSGFYLLGGEASPPNTISSPPKLMKYWKK